MVHDNLKIPANNEKYEKIKNFAKQYREQYLKIDNKIRSDPDISEEKQDDKHIIKLIFNKNYCDFKLYMIEEYLGKKVYSEYHMEEKRFQRQLSQGGCSRAYSLTQDDYNFAFAAQELGYGYTSVAKYLQIKPSTVKDWFNGRSRKKEREQFNKLSRDEKSQLIGRVKIAELSGKPKSISSI